MKGRIRDRKFKVPVDKNKQTTKSRDVGGREH
jgi:hypothetical protein